MSNKIFFYDLETTGLHPDCCIHQISGKIYEIETDSVLETFNFHVRPHIGARIEKEAMELCGLTLERLQGYPHGDQAYKALVCLICRHIERYNPDSKMYLGGYNISSFDNDFFKDFFSGFGDNYFGSYFHQSPVMDVYHLAALPLAIRRRYMPNFKLATVAGFLGVKVDSEALHEASYDVDLTIQCFRIIRGLTADLPMCIRKNGIMSLDGLDIGSLMNALKTLREERKAKFNIAPAEKEFFIYE
jgi:DNA polymerase III alpha subunit (gram-positive type)